MSREQKLKKVERLLNMVLGSIPPVEVERIAKAVSDSYFAAQNYGMSTQAEYRERQDSAVKYGLMGVLDYDLDRIIKMMEEV